METDIYISEEKGCFCSSSKPWLAMGEKNVDNGIVLTGLSLLDSVHAADIYYTPSMRFQEDEVCISFTSLSLAPKPMLAM